MDRSRTASDRVRPFLEAMERSIDSVRRQRMEESGEITPAPAASPEPASPSRPATPQAAPPSPAIRPHEPAAVNGETQPASPPRLKARPKRPSSFNNDRYNNNRDNLSQAG